MFCVNCGKELRENFKFCAYCGTKVVELAPNEFSKAETQKETNKGNWPIAIFKDSAFRKIRFFAYDIATECETRPCETQEEAIYKITKDIENWKHTVEELPTEQQIKKNDYIQELIDDEYELIDIVYLNIELDNN